MMKFIRLILLLLFAANISAQNLNDQQWNVISTSGEEYSSGGYQLAWVLGEMMVETYSERDYKLSQGFLNEYARLVPTKDYLPDLDVKVFPNPVLEVLTIKSNSEKALEVRLTNMAGQQMLSPFTLGDQNQLDLTDIISGTYLLSLYDDENRLLKTFKFQKIH